MSKQTSSRKKKLDQAQPIAQPSINPSPQLKINPHICLISPTYQVNTIKDYRCFMKKRKYSKKMKIEYPGSPYANSPINKYLLKSVRKMKYLQGFQTKMTQHYHTHEKLCRLKRRVRSIDMDLTIYSHLKTFKGDFAKRLKGLLNLNLTSLKVQLYYSNHTNETLLSKAHEVLANYLKYMSNLKTFSFMIGRPQIDEFPGAGTFNQGIVSKKVSSKFKRLRKIENLALSVFGFPNCDSFAQDFNYLSNLKSINVNFMATTQTQGKQLIQNLSKIQTLTSVTLYHYCEPDDILLLAIKVPSLRSIIIKDDWLFDSKETPSRSLINNKGFDIVQLHFDFPMDIDSDSDVEFLVNFLTAFPQLQSLHLRIQSGGENEAIVAPIGKQINKFSQLQRLQLGVLSYSKGIVSPFLSSINRLSNLKEISLTLKRDCQQGWDVEIQELYQALKIFLLQSKELKQLNLAWDKFNQQCAECFKLIINEIESLNLNSIRFKYLPPNTKHDKPHDKILRVFENLFVKSSVEIKHIDIATYCGGHHAQDCSYKMQKIQKAIQSNKKIKNFIFVGEKSGLFSEYDI